VTLANPEGVILGVPGPDGAGKTTLLLIWTSAPYRRLATKDGKPAGDARAGRSLSVGAVVQKNAAQMASMAPGLPGKVVRSALLALKKYPGDQVPLVTGCVSPACHALFQSRMNGTGEL
jgi:ABC-type Mn2+/Zn2+ transport system ATPase subunit